MRAMNRWIDSWRGWKRSELILLPSLVQGDIWAEDKDLLQMDCEAKTIMRAVAVCETRTEYDVSYIALLATKHS